MYFISGLEFYVYKFWCEEQQKRILIYYTATAKVRKIYWRFILKIGLTKSLNPKTIKHLTETCPRPCKQNPYKTCDIMHEPLVQTHNVKMTRVRRGPAQTMYGIFPKTREYSRIFEFIITGGMKDEALV